MVLINDSGYTVRAYGTIQQQIYQVSILYCFMCKHIILTIIQPVYKYIYKYNHKTKIFQKRWYEIAHFFYGIYYLISGI